MGPYHANLHRQIALVICIHDQCQVSLSIIIAISISNMISLKSTAGKIIINLLDLSIVQISQVVCMRGSGSCQYPCFGFWFIFIIILHLLCISLQDGNNDVNKLGHMVHPDSE